MSLPHIRLGLLAEPATGYEIKQRFDQTLRHFWPAELSQIYPALPRLHSGGLLSVRAQASRQGPERRVYRRTAKGRRALLAWLDSSIEPGDLRIGYLARVFFAGEWDDLSRTRAAIASLREGFERDCECWSRSGRRPWNKPADPCGTCRTHRCMPTSLGVGGCSPRNRTRLVR